MGAPPVAVRTSLLPAPAWRTSTCQPSSSVSDEAPVPTTSTTWITGWPRTPTPANPVCGVWVTCTAVWTIFSIKESLDALFAPGTRSRRTFGLYISNWHINDFHVRDAFVRVGFYTFAVSLLFFIEISFLTSATPKNHFAKCLC